MSLELDGELSQLERAMLAAHVLRCAECRAYRGEVRGFTRTLRAAALEAAPSIVVRRFRRGVVATRIQAGAAAAMAFALVGVATQVVQGRSDGSPVSIRISHFETQNELEREQQLIQGNASSSGGSATRSSGDATVR